MKISFIALILCISHLSMSMDNMPKRDKNNVLLEDWAPTYPPKTSEQLSEEFNKMIKYEKNAKAYLQKKHPTFHMQNFRCDNEGTVHAVLINNIQEQLIVNFNANTLDLDPQSGIELNRSSQPRTMKCPCSSSLLAATALTITSLTAIWLQRNQ